MEKKNANIVMAIHQSHVKLLKEIQELREEVKALKPSTRKQATKKE